jgi:hypothetical protein
MSWREHGWEGNTPWFSDRDFLIQLRWTVLGHQCTQLTLHLFDCLLKSWYLLLPVMYMNPYNVSSHNDTQAITTPAKQGRVQSAQRLWPHTDCPQGTAPSRKSVKCIFVTKPWIWTTAVAPSHTNPVSVTQGHPSPPWRRWGVFCPDCGNFTDVAWSLNLQPVLWPQSPCQLWNYSNTENFEKDTPLSQRPVCDKK